MPQTMLQAHLEKRRMGASETPQSRDGFVAASITMARWFPR